MINLLLALAIALQDPPKPPQETPDVKVVGRREKPLERLEAPTHGVDEHELEQYDYDDVHRVLRAVPGVTIREEDGYGLRPNIGVRGTSTERSAKVTLMEDGILFAPAPYAAPAAYYFPLSTRMIAMDGTIGPNILRFGPNTIGGAFNFRTREIPPGPSASLDLAVGSFGYHKAHVWAGFEARGGDSAFGLLAEGVEIGSEGFKDLDGGGDTGFLKSEYMVKGAYSFGPQRIQLKLGYSEEGSDETYLGLTDDDFDADPYRRYRASQLDRMEWERLQFELFHDIDLGANAVISSAVYHHDFDRVWEKVNRFRTGPDLNTILRNPDSGVNAVYYAVLEGEIDSSNAGEQLMLGTNDRRFVSQGAQSDFRWAVEDARGRIRQAVEAGIRLHRDEAVRHHTEDAYRMESGLLVFNGSPTLVNTDTTSTSTALAAHAAYTHRFGQFVVTPRLRAEFIDMDFEDHATGADDSDSTAILLPGLLASWEASDEWAVHAGVYRGFSPEAPGQKDEIDPEESVNYELGAAWGDSRGGFSVTGFFNDYSNLTGDDTFSSGGDGSGDQFNGGEVNIYGLEVAGRYVVEAGRVGIPLTLSYTFMRSEFLTTFSSDNPQFGDVEEGDELPYVPAHQLSVSVGAEIDGVAASLSLNYLSMMREVAGTGDPDRYDEVPARTVLDLAASWTFQPGARVYVSAYNLFDVEYVVSHRPYGARPGMPRQFHVGFALSF